MKRIYVYILNRFDNLRDNLSLYNNKQFFINFISGIFIISISAYFCFDLFTDKFAIVSCLTFVLSLAFNFIIYGVINDNNKTDIISLFKWILKFIILNILFIYLRQHTEGEREVDSLLNREPNAGLDPRTPGS